MNQPVYLIAAVDTKMGLGKKGGLAWKLPGEMKYFHTTTTKTKDSSKQKMVIMGRTTWESIPDKFRPLKNRKNVVLSSQLSFKIPGVDVARSLDEAFALAPENIETIFIIGGARVYAQAINHPRTTGVYLTRLQKDFSCDVFFPPLPPVFTEKKLIGSGEEKGVKYDFWVYTKKI